ncbi:MAG: PAAR domain-containing protein [Pseudomonadota bacterium]
MEALIAAARLGDPVAHTASKGWMMAGLIGGALLGAAIAVATGGAALVVVAAIAAGASAGGGLGELLGTMSWAPTHVTGSLAHGSSNVFINSRAAMRAHLSQGTCSEHSGPQILAQGSKTVFINSWPASRKGDKLVCSAIVNAGSPNVFIGGATATTDKISPEIPGWVNWALLGVGFAAAVVLAGPLVAVLATVGSFAGGEAGSWLGGKYFGEGSDGQKWAMLGGSLVGGLAGAKGATAFAGDSPTVLTAPNGTTIELPKAASLSNLEVRQWYLENEAKIPSLLDPEASLQEQANQAWGLRNSFRSAARDAMIDQDAADELRATRPNLTWDETVAKYSGDYSGDDLWQQIINASQRSNKQVNQSLGITPPGGSQ